VCAAAAAAALPSPHTDCRPHTSLTSTATSSPLHTPHTPTVVAAAHALLPHRRTRTPQGEPWLQDTLALYLSASVDDGVAQGGSGGSGGGRGGGGGAARKLKFSPEPNETREFSNEVGGTALCVLLDLSQ
jgi:uncharacterized membrane protein YgcG